MKFLIEQLNAQEWKGYAIDFTYTAHNYLDVKMEAREGSFYFSFVKTPFERPLNKTFTDTLFQDFYDDIVVWGVVENGVIKAVIETCVESWNQRLRVCELWICEEYRRMGLGKRLMDLAKNRARELQLRAIILETQTCNENAIAFYLSQGFLPVGFNAIEYSNTDIEKHEVRIEMGLIFQN